MALSRMVDWFSAKLYCCFLLCSLTAVGQTVDPAPAPVAKSADEVLQLVASTYERNAIASLTAPYHFKATFETFDTVGQTTGSGFIERWVSSPQLMKTVTRFGDHAMAEYFDNEKTKYTDDGFGGNIMLYFAKYALFYGVFPPAGIIHRKPQATSVVSLPNGDTLDCQGYIFEIGPPEFPQPPSDRFCVSRASNDLVLRHTSNLTIRYSDFAPLLDKSIARTITGSQGSQVRFRVKVEEIDQASLPGEQMTAPTDASLTSPEPNIWAMKPEEERPTHADKVDVPPALKASHASGVVELYCLISRSGKTIDVEPRFATSPELASYATEVVKGYWHKPIMRNGKPIQVITTSFLKFNF
jgi:hypothetical protein